MENRLIKLIFFYNYPPFYFNTYKYLFSSYIVISYFISYFYNEKK